MTLSHYKDQVLSILSNSTNISQFVSFSPNLEVRHCVIYNIDSQNLEAIELISSLIQSSLEKRVNIRSFDPKDPKSKEFIYGLKSPQEVWREVQRLASQGLHTIVNETIDINDGGVSGVIFGNIIEFSPQDTPRCVEKEGTVTLERNIGLKLLRTVYGFNPQLDFEPNYRVEFSIHPQKRGHRKDHTIIWEIERFESYPKEAHTTWPNNFSRFIGDKAFGLLIGHVLGFKIPRTTVISRNIAPFTFGQETKSQEIWLRTCPIEPVPGKYTTCKGWKDPYEIMAKEDPEGTVLGSIISQSAVPAHYSGALLSDDDKNKFIIEGTKGAGDRFMQGETVLDDLPSSVVESINATYRTVRSALGPIRMEWVFDGSNTWIVQLHVGATIINGIDIYPGQVNSYINFEVEKGLENLRITIDEALKNQQGIRLIGKIGITSHMGDILRKAKVPSCIIPKL